MAGTRRDIRRADDVGHRQTGIIVEGVRSQVELLVTHLHIVVEDRHLRLGVILAPVGGQRCALVHHLSAFEEIGVVIETVEVQGIGIERCLTVLQHHILTGFGHLVVTIVEGIVGEE